MVVGKPCLPLRVPIRLDFSRSCLLRGGNALFDVVDQHIQVQISLRLTLVGLKNVRYQVLGEVPFSQVKKKTIEQV